MSLQHLAEQVRSKGRGKDTLLVHMSPREVGGLQALAMAHGGSLTVNPDTGLPEAGFLESILPTIAGIGLSVAFPAASPALIGAGVGGATALATGSIEKGLMAGLGGWGGAGIGSGLMGLGAGAGMSGAGAAGLGAATAGDIAAMGNLGLAPTAASNFANLGAGLGAAASAPGAALSQIGYGPVAAALAPAVFNTEQQNQQNNQDLGYIRPYDYNYATQEYTAQTPVAASEWGSRTLADGGEVKPDAATIDKRIASTYQDVLGRAPDQPGLEYWRQQALGGAPISSIRQAMLESPEFQSRAGMPAQAAADRINTMYFNMLNRSPDPEGMAYWQNALQTGSSPEAIRQAIALSPEAQARRAPALNTPQPLGESMIPMRYGSPTPPVSPDVLNYNQMLANRARNEYINMPQLQAMRPRSPEEIQAGRDLMAKRAEDIRTQMQEKGKPTAPSGDELQAQIDAAIASATANMQTPQNFSDMVGGYASGGITNLGSYSDGGSLLKGPGDGVSDDIPATIADKQPARLADGEFVVPARIVSELGNGSTDAGAKRLYAMMDRIQKTRSKTVGKDKVAVDSKAYEHLPA